MLQIQLIENVNTIGNIMLSVMDYLALCLFNHLLSRIVDLRVDVKFIITFLSWAF